MRILGRLLVGLLVIVGALLGAARWRYGGGATFPDRTGQPSLPETALEVVADLDWPPGNIAVAPNGRLFFTFHPEASPPMQVVEWVDERAVSYPPSLPEELAYQSILSIRIDRQGRLWALDNGNHGLGSPRILAFDLATGTLAYRLDFPSSIAPLGSHLNDFQVSPDGLYVYIADASILGKRPALVVVDVEARETRRLLENDPSVRSQHYVPVVQGRRMEIAGLFAIRPGVDSIALDRRGEWLYFAPVMNESLSRIATTDLRDTTLAPTELAIRVERYAPKTPSDGLTTDLGGRVYIADPDESAIVRIDADRSLTTLLKSKRLRWPDGMSFGPDGWLYVTASSLHHVISRSPQHIREHAPYQIFRFRPDGPGGIPGH